jgi:hypothetical protein
LPGVTCTPWWSGSASTTSRTVGSKLRWKDALKRLVALEIMTLTSTVSPEAISAEAGSRLMVGLCALLRALNGGDRLRPAIAAKRAMTPAAMTVRRPQRDIVSASG